MKRIMLIGLFIVLLWIIPLYAQEAETTPEVEAPAVIATEDEIGSGTIVMSFVALVGIIVTTVVATGGLSLVVLPRVIRQIRTNPDTIAVAEHIGNKVSKETAARVDNALAQVNDTVSELRLLAKEMTDGIAASSKTSSN